MTVGLLVYVRGVWIVCVSPLSNAVMQYVSGGVGCERVSCMPGMPTRGHTFLGEPAQVDSAGGGRRVNGKRVNSVHNVCLIASRKMLVQNGRAPMFIAEHAGKKGVKI